MEQQMLVLAYLLMTLLQIYHIFEEIGARAYVLAGSLGKYLLVASVLVTLSFLSLALLILDLRIGYFLAVVGAGIATMNGLVHVIGYARTKEFYESIGAGVFTSIPLGIMGIIVLFMLLRIILG